MVIQYEIVSGSDELYGSRSLSTIRERLASIVLGPDQLFEGQPAFYRVMAINPDTDELISEAQVEVLVVGEEDEYQTVLWTGETNELGIAEVEFTPTNIAGRVTLQFRIERDERSAESTHTVFIERSHRLVVTTDKSLYQPGETIHISLSHLSQKTSQTPHSKQTFSP